MMIKMRKKNYIQERKNNYALDEEINNIAVGGGMNTGFDGLWRGKTESFAGESNPEKNFYLKEVMKKFQTNQDELKGYNYKYVLQLSDLLGQKDKDFSKKRLELYNNRIQREKKYYSKTNEKIIKKKKSKAEKTMPPAPVSNYYIEKDKKEERESIVSVFLKLYIIWLFHLNF